MGMTSARKAASILANVERVIAIEGLAAAQGLDLRTPLEPAAGTATARTFIRTLSPRLDEDRPLSKDIETLAEGIASGELTAAVEAATGPLH
jgi:histidine ammonia-lyase